MPNRYIDRYRKLKSARLKYKQSNFSSFVEITKGKSTTSCEPNGNSSKLLQAKETGSLSLTLEQYE